MGERRAARWRLPEEGRARRAGSARLTMAEVRSRASEASASRTGRLVRAAAGFEGEEEGDDVVEARGGSGGEAGEDELGEGWDEWETAEEGEEELAAVVVGEVDAVEDEGKIESMCEVEVEVEERGSGGSGCRRWSRKTVDVGDWGGGAKDGTAGDVGEE